MASDPNSTRFILSPDQINAYLVRIGHPEPNPEDASSPNNYGLGLLASLQRQHLASVPFENLSVHYSANNDYTVSLDPKEVYAKIVRRRRGGYCLENNLLFGILLRSFGFNVYSVGGRVNNERHFPGGGFSGWSHMVNIVTLANGKKYMVDVGFGVNAPTQPHPLESGVIRPGVESQEMRLLWDTIAPTTDPNQHLWILQWRDIGSEQWLMNYCFTETEFIPADYEITNYYNYHSPKSWFTQVVVVTKFTQLEYQGPLVGSLVMLNGEVKQRIGATDRGIIERCSNESERIAALKNYFDIELSENEKQCIRGTKCELKP